MIHQDISIQDIRNYLRKSDIVGGVIQDAPYVALQMIANYEISSEEWREEILEMKKNQIKELGSIC